MSRADTVFAVLLVLLAFALIPQTLRLQIGWTAIGPGSGFFPFWLTVLVVIQAVIILARSLRAAVPASSGAPRNVLQRIFGARDRDVPFIEREAVRPLLIAFLPMVAVIAAIRYLGIYIGGGLYLAGYMLFVGRRHWITAVLVSVLIPLALFFIFERWFLMPLPKGILLEYLVYGR